MAPLSPTVASRSWQAKTVRLPGRFGANVLHAVPPVGLGGDGPALLLLHGWMATAALNWSGALAALPAGLEVVAPDLRGHGRLGLGAPRFSMQQCADDQAALIAELGLGPVVAVGYSMGGAVAQVLARRHPGLVAGLVLCATAASFARRPWLRPLVRVVTPISAGAARHCRPLSQAFLRERVGAYDGGEDEGRPHPSWALQERSHADVACFLEAGGALNAFDSKPWLHDLAVPTAVVVTTQDRTVAPWRQDTLSALIPGAKRFVVDAGHDAAVVSRPLFYPVLATACADVAGRATAERRLNPGPH
jgi:3-oxoadipate enol-lactonase